MGLHCAVLADSSRKIIAGREFVRCNTQNTINVIGELVKEYWDICPLRELIMDHGSEFGAHRINKDGSWDSEFKRHIEALGIKPILAGVRHPQTTGKLRNGFTLTRDSEASLKHLRSSFNGIIEGLIEH